MNTPAWFHRELYPGDSGPDVLAVQRLCGAMKTGVMDEDTLARVRGLQGTLQREITGVVDHALAVQMGNVATYGLLPAWFTAQDWSSLPARLGGSADENAIRRFQSHHHIPPTGLIDETTAIALGD